MTRYVLGAVLLVACHANPGTGDDAPIDGTTVDADPGWAMLVSRSWTLPANSEAYRCTRIQIPTDMWVSGFRAISPPGTHHSVLTISMTQTPLGDYDCSPNQLDQQMLYASGVGTDDLLFPDGVAIHLTAGQYINLNLHLYNAMDNQTTQSSGVAVRTMVASQVVHPADMTFAGTLNITVPNDGQPHTANGGCAVPADWHVFTLWPHMHQAATHQTMTVTHGTPITMLDVPYQFSEQKNYPMQDTLIHAGDSVSVTCTYVNNGPMPLVFGDSSDSEMCFTGIYKYPAGGGLFGCVSN
jgi:hypothetical protein